MPHMRNNCCAKTCLSVLNFCDIDTNFEKLKKNLKICQNEKIHCISKKFFEVLNLAIPTIITSSLMALVGIVSVIVFQKMKTSPLILKIFLLSISIIGAGAIGSFVGSFFMILTNNTTIESERLMKNNKRSEEVKERILNGIKMGIVFGIFFTIFSIIATLPVANLSNFVFFKRISNIKVKAAAMATSLAFANFSSQCIGFFALIFSCCIIDKKSQKNNSKNKIN